MEKENFDADNGKHIAQEEHEPVLGDKEEIMKTPLCSYFERYKRAKSQFDTISKGLKVVCNSLLRNKVTAKELETIQLKYTGKQVEVKPSTYLQLDMKVKEDTDMITEIRLRELPSIGGVRISNVVDSSHIVNNFLKESIPQNLKCIQFNFNSSTEADCEDFVDSLGYAARKVKTNVSIYNTNLSSTHFRRILSAFSHGIEIGFYKCTIILEEELNLSEIKHSNIYRLTLRNGSEGKLKAFDPVNLENLIKGISNCDTLKSSLRVINIFRSNWKGIEGILRANGLQHLCVCRN